MPKLLINPYKVGPPVEGVNFYGRSELLDKVYQTLQQSNVVLLQGQRRIGKTSFLKQLAAYTEARNETKHLLTFVPVLFDIQRYVQDSLPQFQMHLAEAIARPLPLTVPEMSELEADLTLFRDAWLPQAYEELGDRVLVILVDEFDNLEGLATSRTMQTLIPFLAQLVSRESRLKWVLTFGRLAGRLPIQYDPIVSSGVQLRLSFLSPQVTQELLQNPVEGTLIYKAEAIDRIYELTSGQPHLTQALGSEIFQSVVLEKERDEVTIEDVNTAIPYVLENYGNAIASIVRVPPIEERVLAAVAWLTENNVAATRVVITRILIENDIQLSRDELISTIEGLLNWELLSGDIEKVKISIELLRVWIIKNLTIAPRSEQATDILSELAQKSIELAERILQSGRYDLAIKQYQNALEHVPNSLEALRGLAEAHRLRGELADRVTVFARLYEIEPTALNELLQASIDCAEESIFNQNIVNAIEQYKMLLKVRVPKYLEKNLLQRVTEELDKQLGNLDETFLGLKQEEFLREFGVFTDSAITIFNPSTESNDKQDAEIIKNLLSIEIKLQKLGVNSLIIYPKLKKFYLQIKSDERLDWFVRTAISYNSRNKLLKQIKNSIGSGLWTAMLSVVLPFLIVIVSPNDPSNQGLAAVTFLGFIAISVFLFLKSLWHFLWKLLNSSSISRLESKNPL